VSRLHALAQAQLAAEHRHRRRGGRVPSPLVGVAAVTGHIDLLGRLSCSSSSSTGRRRTFWALALLKQRDYGRAGVPMAPLVWGERETMRNMLWYTLILVPLTLLPSRSARSACRTS
jgi:heme O synthase-like polyprenyltransferase